METASASGGTDGLDYFSARFNSSRLGRFMNVDTALGAQLPIRYGVFAIRIAMESGCVGRRNTAFATRLFSKRPSHEFPEHSVCYGSRR